MAIPEIARERPSRGLGEEAASVKGRALGRAIQGRPAPLGGDSQKLSRQDSWVEVREAAIEAPDQMEDASDPFQPVRRRE